MEYKTEAEYNVAMAEILLLMNKGEAKLSKPETENLRAMALAAQAYEKSIYTVPPPSTFGGMIELRMYQMKLKQNELAEKLGVSPAKLSLILNGKQKPNVSFIKAVYTRLNVLADFILQHI